MTKEEIIDLSYSNSLALAFASKKILETKLKQLKSDCCKPVYNDEGFRQEKDYFDKEKYDKAKEEINRESIECLKENYSYSFGVYTDLFSFLNIIDPIE